MKLSNSILTLLLVCQAAGLSSHAAEAVDASREKPNLQATSLMPVPIYPFAVHALAFDPKGQVLLSGNGEGIVRRWSIPDGQLQATLRAHADWTFALAWLPGGAQFLTGGGDNLVQLYDHADAVAPVRTYRGPDADVHALAVRPDGKSFAAAGDDRNIYIYEMAEPEPAKVWRAHSRQIPTLALSPDGRLLASGSRDNAIGLWEYETGKAAGSLTNHTEDVMALAFSADGKWLASASYDKTIRIWDPNQQRLERTLTGHTQRVFAVAFSPDGRWLASGGDASVRLWNWVTGEAGPVVWPHGTIRTDKGEVQENISSVAFHPGGRLLAAGSTTGNVYLVAVPEGNIVRVLTAPKPAVQ